MDARNETESYFPTPPSLQAERQPDGDPRPLSPELQSPDKFPENFARFADFERAQGVRQKLMVSDQVLWDMKRDLKEIAERLDDGWFADSRNDYFSDRLRFWADQIRWEGVA